MCGLVGMAGTLTYRHKLVMKDLLFLDSLRGKDSTGISALKRDRSLLTRKFTVPGYEFIEYPVVERAMSDGDQLWIGHNRFKTTGEISKQNAHPFEVYDTEGDVILVGAHNGTLLNKYELDKRLAERFDTDSEALFNHLVVAKDFKEAISIVKGAWSLVFWDATTDKINFLRNKERPLCFAYSKDRESIIWASEAWMLINACRRNGLELEQNAKGLSCYVTNVDTLYSLEIPQEKGKKLPDLSREGGYSGAPEHTFHQQGYHHGWWDQYGDDDPNVDEEKQKAAAKGSEKAKADGETTEKKIITLGDYRTTYSGFKGERLTEEQYLAIKEKGCAWNGCEIKGGFAFIDEKNIVCTDCMGDRHPKDGDRVRQLYCPFEDDPLDDDPAFDIGPYQEDSPEYKSLIEAAALGSAAKTVG
jgi:predicted glutamine amidotransferase